jgi:hypothetical protein
LSLDYLASVSVDQLATQPLEARDHWIRHIIDVVVLTTESLVIRLDALKVGQCHEIPQSNDSATEKPARTCPFRPEIQDHGRQIVITLAIQIKRLDGRRILLSPDGRDLILPVEPEPSPHIVNAIGLADRWHETLLSSRGTIRKLARQEAISESTVRKLLPLTHLGPEILSAALKGLLPPSVTLDDLLAAANDLDWTHQLRELGLDAPSAPAPATRETNARLSIPGPPPG